MKLLVQSDDYGITPAVSSGILYGIEHGIVRNTGLFVNMEWAPMVVEWIRPYLDKICFGIDLNLSAGCPVCAYNEVKSLCQNNEMFMTSKMHRQAENAKPMLYEEILKEYHAQIDRFIELVGKKPGYLHGHAYRNEDTDKAMSECSKHYEIPISSEILKEKGVKCNPMSWYPMQKEYDSVLDIDTVSYFVNDVNGYLDSDISFILTHCGYVDRELFQLSSYTLLRTKDLEAMTSEEVKGWVIKNNIELITYYDLQKL
ncbi:MAG: ChbG/HpnK family deacetylase [Erysipelotrichaceae bacterium]|nr:ChbG/HpnK family deacetylase [Erysipelotrichaceae bacterium]